MRCITAFHIAPLTAPLMLAVYLASRGRPEGDAFFLFLGSVFAAYVGTAVLGIPIYLFLRAKSWTAFWIAPIAGLVVGMVMWYVTVALAWMALGASLSSAVADFDRLSMFLGGLQAGALPGAAVGAVLWLIARPDRQKAMTKSEAA